MVVVRPLHNTKEPEDTGLLVYNIARAVHLDNEDRQHSNNSITSRQAKYIRGVPSRLLGSNLELSENPTHHHVYVALGTPRDCSWSMVDLQWAARDMPTLYIDSWNVNGL